MLHVNDYERTITYSRWLAETTAPDIEATGERERRLVHMLAASVGDQVLLRDMTV